ncbi:hypothetical protein F4801DRAFT_597349 [Xylaria longipes]|nr:hypothetical protein F4801DRAFT_597349 [Xylaria longipes]
MMVERSPILKLILDLFSFLQEEIMKVSVDQSIFAWSFESLDIEKDLGRISLMAPWPSNTSPCSNARIVVFPKAPILVSLSQNESPIDYVYLCSSSLGSDSYIFYFFDAVNHPVWRAPPLKAGNDDNICYRCQRILFKRPSSLPSSRQVSVSLDFEHETAGGIRNTRFVLNAQIDFNERRGFLRYNLVADKESFWSHIPGRRAENMRGRAEVAILGGQTSRHRNYREIPIFLSFEEADEGAIGHQTSKTVVFRQAEDAGGFRQSQGELARRGLDLHSERP